MGEIRFSEKIGDKQCLALSRKQWPSMIRRAQVMKEHNSGETGKRKIECQSSDQLAFVCYKCQGFSAHKESYQGRMKSSYTNVLTWQ